MMKPVLNSILCLCLFTALSACSDDSGSSEDLRETEQTTDQEATNPEAEEIVEASPFGNFSGLIGEWTVDAATAGVKLDLAFDEDGSFKQSMGTIHGVGSWKRIDDENIHIVTQNTSAEGQTWKITDLTDETVNICWKPTAPKPKTIPMKRVR